MSALWRSLLRIAWKLGLGGRTIYIPKQPNLASRNDLIRMQHRQNLQTYEMDDEESVRILAINHRMSKSVIRCILRND